MIVFIFRLIFFTINTLSNLISRVILTACAQLLVLFIQAFRVPGQAAHGALQQIGDAIKACFETILELIWEIISSIISSIFDAVIEAIMGSVSVTGSGIGSLVEKTRTSFDDLLKDLPELGQEFSEMVSTLVIDLLNNYKDAFGYVTENA
ncbi:hypothetical protein M5689_019028 [Euphorbia peplus]|nr:hypothetical protein M5689_019028 [Euphorbia peplus]